jgi:hypothetical protein
MPAVAVLALYPQIVMVRMFYPEDVFTIRNYLKGVGGLLVDGQAGLLFQAPLWALGAVAALRWRELGAGARLGLMAAAPYLLLLFPRAEWHGGWSPPLRYVVVFLPLFALLAAHAVERFASRGVLVAAALWSAGLTLHGLASPARLFQLATGESAWGGWLSRVWEADVSRLVPSAIRPNGAAVAACAVVAGLAVWSLRRRGGAEAGRLSSAPVAALLSLAITAGFAAARVPGEAVELEDAHVRHDGGGLYPEEFTVARFRFRGGWAMHEGTSASFLFAGGRATLWYSAAEPATVQIGGQSVELAATGGAFAPAAVELPASPGRYTLECVRGAPVVDRIAAE